MGLLKRRKKASARTGPVTQGLPPGKVEPKGNPPPASSKGQAEHSSLAAHAKLSPEARAKLAAGEIMTAEVLKFAQDNPEEASRLIRVWLAQAKGQE